MVRKLTVHSSKENTLRLFRHRKQALPITYLMDEHPFYEIKQLRLQNGDRVVLEYPGKLTQAEVERISRTCEREGIGLPVILDCGLRLTRIVGKESLEGLEVRANLPCWEEV